MVASSHAIGTKPPSGGGARLELSDQIPIHPGKDDSMFGSNQVMSSFSSNDIAACKTFYGETLGFDVEEMMNGLVLKFGGGGQAFVYPKPNHEPATFTVLTIMVDDVEKAVDDLRAKGVTFEHYTEDPIRTDEKGIARDMGNAIAWCKDPAGNIIGVAEMPSA